MAEIEYVIFLFFNQWGHIYLHKKFQVILTKIEGVAAHKRFTKLNTWFTEKIYDLPNSDLEYKMMLSTK